MPIGPAGRPMGGDIFTNLATTRRVLLSRACRGDGHAQDCDRV